MTLYEEVVALKIPHSSHYSDLYLPRTKQVIDLLKKHGVTMATAFKNQVEGGLWMDVPFLFTPFWDRKK